MENNSQVLLNFKLKIIDKKIKNEENKLKEIEQGFECRLNKFPYKNYTLLDELDLRKNDVNFYKSAIQESKNLAIFAGALSFLMFGISTTYAYLANEPLKELKLFFTFAFSITAAVAIRTKSYSDYYYAKKNLKNLEEYIFQKYAPYNNSKKKIENLKQEKLCLQQKIKQKESLETSPRNER